MMDGSVPPDTGHGGTGDACASSAVEVCNRIDDNCDGEVDEDTDALCSESMHAQAECVEYPDTDTSRCVIIGDCHEGHDLCDGNPANGCEPYCDCHLCADGGVAACEDSTPSYRSARCDSCACRNCGHLIAQCQDHPDPNWARNCRAMLECFVTSIEAGKCSGIDCYMRGNGPCADETNVAAGGADGSDSSQVIYGCAEGDILSPAAACAAALNFNEQCAAIGCEADCRG
jgi:hypothetical protein